MLVLGKHVNDFDRACPASVARQTDAVRTRVTHGGPRRTVFSLPIDEPLVRGHAAWALGRIGTQAARQALSGRAEVEGDAWVRDRGGARRELRALVK
jgi:hypothetical protein